MGADRACVLLNPGGKHEKHEALLPLHWSLIRLLIQRRLRPLLHQMGASRPYVGRLVSAPDVERAKAWLESETRYPVNGLAGLLAEYARVALDAAVQAAEEADLCGGDHSCVNCRALVVKALRGGRGVKCVCPPRPPREV